MAELHVGVLYPYQTIEAAITAHNAGDTIVLHDAAYTLSAGVIIKASAVLKTVAVESVINSPASGNVISLSVGASIDAGVVITGPTSTGIAIYSDANGAVSVRCTVRDFAGRPIRVNYAATVFNFYGTLWRTGDIDVALGTLNMLFATAYSVNNSASSARAIRASGGTVKIYHSLLVAMNGSSGAFICSSGVFDVKNSVIIGPGGVVEYPTASVMTQTGGTATVSNCAINSHYLKNVALFSGTVENSGNIVQHMPKVRFGVGRSAFVFHAVDSNHTSNGSLLAYANALASVGAKMSYFPDDHDHLNDEQKQVLRDYVALGHDLGCEGNSSSPLDYTAPMSVAYVGAGANPRLTIASGSSLSVDTDSGNVITVDISSAVIGGTSVAGSLVKALNDHADLTASVYDHGTGDYDDAYANCLADGVYSLSATAVDILWDKDRYYMEEITKSSQNIYDIVGHRPVSYMFARYRYASDAVSYLESSGFTCALSGIDNPKNIIDASLSRYNLGLVATQTASNMFGDNTEPVVRARARDYAAYALAVGRLDGWLLAENTGTNVNAITYFADELIKCGVRVCGLAEAYEYMSAPYALGDNKTLESSLGLHRGAVITGINDVGQLDPWGNAAPALPNISMDQGAGASYGPWSTCNAPLPTDGQVFKSHALPIAAKKLTVFPGVASQAQINEAKE